MPQAQPPTRAVQDVVRRLGEWDWFLEEFKVDEWWRPALKWQQWSLQLRKRNANLTDLIYPKLDADGAGKCDWVTWAEWRPDGQDTKSWTCIANERKLILSADERPPGQRDGVEKCWHRWIQPAIRSWVIATSEDRCGRLALRAIVDRLPSSIISAC